MPDSEGEITGQETALMEKVYFDGDGDPAPIDIFTGEERRLLDELSETGHVRLTDDGMYVTLTEDGRAEI